MPMNIQILVKMTNFHNSKIQFSKDNSRRITKPDSSKMYNISTKKSIRHYRKKLKNV